MSPSDDSARDAMPTPGQNPGPGGGVVAQQQTPNPKAQMTAMLVAGVIQNARRLSMMYPAASEEMNSIMNLIQRAQGKIVNSQPAPETSAPPV